jgi:hypothetical protein
VESGYYRNTTPLKKRFTFSTITSPLDYNHPVSGNREFGIFENPNGDGYTFYIMGVDRQSDWMFALANTFGNSFAKADELWSSIQKNMTNFLNNQGGRQRFKPQLRLALIGMTLRSIY